MKLIKLRKLKILIKYDIRRNDTKNFNACSQSAEHGYNATKGFFFFSNFKITDGFSTIHKIVEKIKKKVNQIQMLNLLQRKLWKIVNNIS